MIPSVIPSWSDLFDIDHCPAPTAFRASTTPWNPLVRITDIVRAVISERPGFYTDVGPDVWAGNGTTVAATASVVGPAVFGADCEIRHAAFVRGRVLAGDGCIIGNSCELKNCILFDRVQAPHFNYVGDSILGYRTHLGAGVILSNVRLDLRTVTIRADSQQIDTAMEKLGALIGDHVEIGSNSVCNPGTIIGRKTIVYPLSLVGGVVPAGSVVKSAR